MKPSSLRRKVLGALIVVFGVTMVVTAISSAWRMRTNLTAQYASKGTAIADGIANSSVEMLLFRDVSSIQALIDQHLEIEGVAYVVVVDPQGEVLAHTFAPAVPDEIRSLKGSEDATVVQELTIPGQGEFSNVSSPILAGKVGHVYVGMDRKLVTSAMWSAIPKQIALIVVIFFFSLLAAYALMNRIIDPLNQLTAYANRLAASGSTAEAQGASDAQILPLAQGSDEVGQMARAFRDMVFKVSAREEELRAAHAEMERRVNERTADLANANEHLHQEISERKHVEASLRDTAAELTRSNAELNQFAYISSHDLQEPLRKVQAFGDMLATACGETLSDEARDYLSRMQNSAKRMQGLIGDLLIYSRVVTQAKPFVQVDLADTAREVLADFAVRIRDLKGRVDLGELPSLEADPMQMRQLLQNLIGNALKFHRPNDAPLVIVRCRVLDENASNPVCELTVQDNGIGFDEKYLDRIFAPFQRLHGLGEYEGTGMGLAICHKIIERHSGTLAAHSIPGQGAAFIVTIPMRQSKGDIRES